MTDRHNHQQLYIYNTMSRSKELFVPLMQSGKKDYVGIYSCGPTVYRNPHVGNMRSFHYADLLQKTIKYILGLPVKHVMNMTDVGHLTDDADAGDDKMEKGAKHENLTVWELADKYIATFKLYQAKMRIGDLDAMPRATDFIQEQIDMICILEQKGFTYEIPGDGIYMDTSKIDNYGAIARLDLQELQAGARIDDSKKNHHSDFALWKYSPAGEKRQMERDSPRGRGFPGRHIECSAMASAYLGDQFDIHTGGVDHIGVHHTNEIAQSECCFGHKRVNYRMHNQFLELGGKKMSKSSGTIQTIDSIEEQGYDALDLKFLFLQGHYRSFLDFTPDSIKQAQTARRNLHTKLQNFADQFPDIVNDPDLAIMTYAHFINKYSQYMPSSIQETCGRIVSALCDDLATPSMLADIHSACKTHGPAIFPFVMRLDSTVLRVGLSDPIAETLIPADVVALAQERLMAKNTKDYARADAIRTQVLSMGWIIKDSADGYTIEQNTP